MPAFYNRMIRAAKAIQAHDPAAGKSLWLIWLTYPGLHALALHVVSRRLWRMGLPAVAKVCAYIGRMLTGIEIHPAAIIGRNLFIDHGMGVVIGETAVIGNNVTMYQGVTLGGVSLDAVKRHPTIEDDVIIGAGAQILGPITIGKGARVGANAVVLNSVPAGSTVVGVPAQPVILQEAANQAGFVAYAADCSDPILQRLEALEQEIADLRAEQAADQGLAPAKARRTTGVKV